MWFGFGSSFSRDLGVKMINRECIEFLGKLCLMGFQFFFFFFNLFGCWENCGKMKENEILHLGFILFFSVNEKVVEK